MDEHPAPPDPDPGPASIAASDEPEPSAVELYSCRLELPGGTWVRMWFPSFADLRAMSGIDPTHVTEGYLAVVARMEAALVAFAGPRPGSFMDQPIEWHTTVLGAWIASAKDGGLPPAPAAS